MPAANRKQLSMQGTENDLDTGEPDLALDMPSERRAITGSVWMFVITAVFYFLPVANGIVAGLIGGFKIGSTRMALTAAAGVLLFTTVVSWMLFTMLPIPLMGGMSNQMQIALLIALSDIGLLVGAGVGGTIAQNRIDRLNRA